MFDRRRFSLFVAILIFVIGIGWLLWWLFRDKGPEIPTRVAPPVEQAQPVQAIDTRSEEELLQADVRTVVKSFAARFASFSSDRPEARLADLKPLMTESLFTSLRTEQKPGSAYEGFSARLIAVDVEAQTETTARVRTTLQREVTRGLDSQSTLEYVDLLVDLTRIQEVWLVSGVSWTER